jgi:tetratricopeptide (TPR) repeat protein
MLRCAWMAVLWMLSGWLLSAQGVAVRGKVVDARGMAVAGAEVRLERGDNSRAGAAQSATDGGFGFPEVMAGTYSLLAEKGGVRSTAVQVVVTDRGAPESVVVALGGAGAKAGPAMEFADSPNFTIAGVTDWTAAGGHGSDVSLRTSEALNRETLALRPDEHAGRALPGDAAQEARLRKAVEAEPSSFDAHRELGALYLREGRSREAVPLLQKAYAMRPAEDANECDLALALEEAGDLAGARQHVEHALSRTDSAMAHRVAGALDEASGDPLRAVHEFALAVQRDPSEQNTFAWGEELLQHRAVLQAKEVFEQGVTRYPKSVRMRTALGAALFAGALYDQSARRLCEASDLDPGDVEPYRFMGKIEIVAPHFDSCMDARLARYAEMYPQDSLANYFYAMDLWKQQGPMPDGAVGQKVEALLRKAVSLDAQCSDGFLQLGNLKSSEKDYRTAIDLYAKAIGADPQSSEAHYRLGVAYDRVGEREKAKQEFAAHDAINQQQAAETERQRKEIKQFVVEAQKTPAQ